MFRQAIDRYAAGAELPLRAIQGLSREELLAHPVSGTWSIQELVVHLYDSDLVGCDRMRRIAAMDRPLLMGYDQDAFVRTLRYDEVDAAMACEGFRVNRLLMASVLRQLPDSAAERMGIHSERGKVTLLELVEGYAGHVEHHLRFLHDKRRALGKPAS